VVDDELAGNLDLDFTGLSLTQSSDEGGDASGTTPGDLSLLQLKYVGPSEGLYTGDKLFVYVAKFLQWAANISNNSKGVTLYVCSPFYAKDNNTSIMEKLMNKIIGAENLTIVFYTRYKEDHDLVKVFRSLSPEDKEKFKAATIVVHESANPLYFHCKWLAIDKGEDAEKDKRVELLVTTANLTNQHLHKTPISKNDFHQVEFAEHKAIELQKFSDNFLKPMEDISSTSYDSATNFLSRKGCIC